MIIIQNSPTTVQLFANEVTHAVDWSTLSAGNQVTAVSKESFAKIYEWQKEVTNKVKVFLDGRISLLTKDNTVEDEFYGTVLVPGFILEEPVVEEPVVEEPVVEEPVVEEPVVEEPVVEEPAEQ
jgi:hypothetical protein